MYYPKQIPDLLDENFKKNIEYKEYNIKELENYCFCIWKMKSKKKIEQKIVNNILPDASIDIVIDFINQTICFAGFSKETEPLPLDQQIDYLGVRMKPGAFYSIFHIEAEKVMDQSIPFSEIEKENTLEKILSLTETSKRIDCFREYLLKKLKTLPNRIYIEMVDKLYENPKDQTVIQIAHELGYEKRQLYRLFKKNYGVSPKVLLNILRLHLCLTMLLEEKAELMDITIQCGFYDQSHFIKEIKRYTGISPLKLVEQCKI